jgi:hypothetical protein
MSIFGDVGKFFEQNVPGVKEIFGVGRNLTYGTITKAGRNLEGLLKPKPTQQVSPGVQVIHSGGIPPGGPQPSYNITYGAPSYGGGGGGGIYDAWNYQPQYNPYGGSSWGYSTQYPAYSTQPSVMYSAPPQDRTWEDLTLAALPLFL